MVGYKIKRFNNDFIEFMDNEYAHNSSINQKGYKNISENEYEKINLLEKANNYQSSNISVVKSKIIV